jgi:hypothetical protein
MRRSGQASELVRKDVDAARTGIHTTETEDDAGGQRRRVCWRRHWLGALSERLVPQVVAIQSSGQYVFACVSEKSGAVEYFEFRTPLPHQCDADDELWHLAAAPTASPTTCTSPTLTATATATATPTSTACASAAALSSPTPDVLSSSGLESSVPLASPPPSAS